MISDAETLFAEEAQFDVAAATPELSTNVYDTRGGKTSPDNTSTLWGATNEMFGYIRVTTSFVAASTDGNLTITFESSAAAAMTTPTVHHTMAATLEAVLVAGYEYVFRIPPRDTYLRYLGFRMTAADQDFSAGALTLALTPHLDIRKDYASGLTFL
jgi:hypothetical protein